MALDQVYLKTLESCKSNNAINSAILMNPCNYNALVNYVSTPSFLSLGNIPSPLGPVPNPLIPSVTLLKTDPKTKQKTFATTNNWYHNWGIIHLLIQQLVPGTPSNLTCAAGIGTSFIACNGNSTNLKNSGGMILSASSQFLDDLKTDKLVFYPGDDFSTDNQGWLTNSGVKKIKNIEKWKGALWNIRNPDGSGHIAMVLGAEIIYNELVKKWRCYLYTLEFNTSISSKASLVLKNPTEFVQQNLAKEGTNYYLKTELEKNPKYKLINPLTGEEDHQWSNNEFSNPDAERSGGKLAFRVRVLGGLNKYNIKRSTLAKVDGYSGGAWAPNGLTQDNQYLSIGSWKASKNIFEV